MSVLVSRFGCLNKTNTELFVNTIYNSQSLPRITLFSCSRHELLFVCLNINHSSGLLDIKINQIPDMVILLYTYHIN